MGSGQGRRFGDRCPQIGQAGVGAGDQALQQQLEGHHITHPQLVHQVFLDSLGVRDLAQGAIIAAVYALLTIFLAPISSGLVQCRVSEAMSVLPYFTFSSM